MQTPRNIFFRKFFIKTKQYMPGFLSGKKQQIYLRDRVEEYKTMWSQIADDLNAEFIILDRDVWEIKSGNNSVIARLHELPLDNNVVLKICGRKPLIHRMLAKQNLPIPDYIEFNLSSIEKAHDFLKKYPNGIVIKPADGYAGKGVTTHIKTHNELLNAIALASFYSDYLMAEQQVAGKNFRFLVYKGQLIAAVGRSGLWVEGNGNDSVADLLNKIDGVSIQNEDVKFTLQSQSIELGFVPEQDQKILVASVGKGFNGGHELRTEYDKDVIEQVHNSIKDIVERCADIVGANLVGVDIITTDITRELSETAGVINEVNTTPAFHHHYSIGSDKYPPVVKAIVADLLNIEDTHPGLRVISR